MPPSSKKLNEKQNKAFDPNSFEQNMGVSPSEGWANLTNELDLLKQALMPNAQPEGSGPWKYESDKNVLGSQKPMLGEADDKGLSTEEIAKLQEADRKKRELEAYLQNDPVVDQKAIAMDPRLANPENYQRFQSFVSKFRNKNK